jgi:hypothetical protein
LGLLQDVNAKTAAQKIRMGSLMAIRFVVE